ncbi:MAG TPA: hypothetical protein VFO55_03885 [Gemmatimonadaceae bacterium]|nr:hypothetical protein [Gemmatimonadaceae bacterium]
MVAVESNQKAEISLGEFLARRARGASDARLAVDAVVGFAVAIAALLAQGPGWYLFASAGICFLSFGVWGIADRELGEPSAGTRGMRLLLSVARVAAAIIGFTAFAVLVVRALGVALGRIIS